MAGLAVLVVLFAAGCAETHSRVDAGPDAPPPSPDRMLAGFDVYVLVPDDNGLPPGLGMEPQLDFASDGVLHVTHVHQGTGDVLHTFGRVGAVRTEVVARMTTSASRASAAAQALGRDEAVHVAYTLGEGLGAERAERGPDGTWSRHALPFGSEPRDSRHPAIASLADGSILVVGLGEEIGAYREIFALVGDRAPERLGEATDWLGLDVSARGDAAGRALVTYDRGDATVLATRSDAGAWTSTTLEDAQSASLAFAPDGTLHVAFARAASPGGDRAVFHARGPGLVPELVDADHDYQSTTIAVGPDRIVHVGYEVAGTVMYATNAGGSWTPREVEVVSPQNGRPSMAIDPDGRAWFAYRDDDGALVIATPRR